MIGRCCPPVEFGRCRAKAEEKPRYLLGESREILAGHAGPTLGHHRGATHAPKRRDEALSERRVIPCDVVPAHDVHFGRGAGAVRDVGRNTRHAIVNRFPHRLVVGAYRTNHHDGVGDDVLAQAAVERAHGDDRGRRGEIDLAAYDRLEGEHDLGAHNDGIDTTGGERPMRLTTAHDDAKAVCGGGRRSNVVPHATQLPGSHVQAKHGFDFRIVECAILDHRTGTTGRRTLLCWLEEERDGTRHLVAHGSQHLSRSHENRGVHVMTAGVHHTDILAVVGRADR